MLVQHMIEDAVDDLKELIESINEDDSNEIVEIILNSNNIFTIGSEFSEFAASFLTAKLVRRGINSYLIGSVSTPAVSKNDCIIAFSESGESQHVLSTAEIAIRKINPKIISITSNLNSPLSKLSDLSISIKSNLSDDSSVGHGINNLFDISSILFVGAIVTKIYERTEYNQTLSF